LAAELGRQLKQKEEALKGAKEENRESLQQQITL
jgi:hypothetical protein